MMLERTSDPNFVLRENFSSELSCRARSNSLEYRAIYDAAKMAVTKIAEKQPIGTSTLNANDLVQYMDGYLEAAVRLAIKEAKTLEQIDFESLGQLISEHAKFLEYTAPKSSRFRYPEGLHRAETLAIQLLDVKSGDVPMAEAFKINGPKRLQMMEEERARAIPKMGWLDQKALAYYRGGEFEREKANLGMEAGGFESLVVELGYNSLLESTRDGKSALLVTWEGSSTCHGIVAGGARIVGMQHGRIMGERGKEGSHDIVELGSYDRIERSAGRYGRRHAVILFLNPGFEEIRIDRSAFLSKFDRGY